MTNLCCEIPKRAFINSQILQLAAGTQAFNACINSVKSQYGLPSYEFMNQAYIVSLLYCLIVVPKELWLKNEHPIYKDLSEKYFFQEYFNILNGTDLANNEWNRFINHLRNSVSHAHFTIDENLNFTFWDCYGEKGLENYRVSSSSANLMKFISEIGSLIANS